MKKFIHVLSVIFICSPLIMLSQTPKANASGPQKSTNEVFIANDLVANESVLRSIPKEFIDKARTTLHIAYQHTSHGTHVARGLFGLPGYKKGDELLFGIANNSPEPGKLDFHDFAIEKYADTGVDASDLSHDEKAFVNATRKYLDDTANARINVVMWSWCNIAGHEVAKNYLPGMTTLIAEYGINGTKIGKEKGQRQNPVTFVFITGHANKNENTGDKNPKSQAQLIIDYCNGNKQFCLDYYSIDTHDMAGNYWEDAGDDGNSDAYKGNFYADWQNAHQKGIDWYENKLSPGGKAEFGEHNTQHITANRKAFAMWWILARIAGWDGK